MYSGQVYRGSSTRRGFPPSRLGAGLHTPWGRPLRYAVIKRLLDLTAALGLLFALAPLLLSIAVVMMITTGGPILFRQRRIGLSGNEFTIWKFRTMHADRRSVDAGPPGSVGERRVRHKTYADPRVTPFGRFLRRTSLDELPQLLNVVRGDMSMVGPRPELPAIVARYEAWQHDRHVVRPGITGWWQVNRPADRLMHEVVELDLYYVEHCSLWLDIRIVAKTVTTVLRGTGAF